MRYAVIFLIMSLIYVVLFLVNFKIAIKYIFKKQPKRVVISVYTGDGRVRYDRAISLGDNESDLINFPGYIKNNAGVFSKIINYLKKKNAKAELEAVIKQGTGDAALTGIICGLLWAIIGNTLAYISQHLKIIRSDICITPYFEKTIFDVNINCIFHVKLAHIIVLLIKIYFGKKIMKAESKKTIGGEVSG